jgi:hypothetical protein
VLRGVCGKMLLPFRGRCGSCGTRNRGIFGGAIGRPGGRRRCRVGKVAAVDVTRPESSSPSTAETDADGGWNGKAWSTFKMGGLCLLLPRGKVKNCSWSRINCHIFVKFCTHVCMYVCMGARFMGKRHVMVQPVNLVLESSDLAPGLGIAP